MRLEDTMGSEDRQSSHGMSERPKDKQHSACESSEDRDDRKVKGGWRDILDEITYSSGPGDNIYVFG
jgi:hypothetical protein